MPRIRRETFRRLRPWLILAMAVWPAFWHVLDFPEDRDDEFPAVVRPTFSHRPPPAYRLAEPGDTIDRIAIYTSSLDIVLAVTGLAIAARRRQPGLWPSAVGLSLAAFWYAANPAPTFDGWHGLAWRALIHPETPPAVKLVLGAAALALIAVVAGPLVAHWPERRVLWRQARGRRAVALLAVALVAALLRQVEIPGVEPAGYWPRWCLVWSLIAFGLALVRLFPTLGLGSWRWRLGVGVLGTSAWYALVVAGIALTWYHRPLERLRTVEPGKIYISAMPTPRGLAIAQQRHHFKTIINLFPEDTPLRSPLFPQEQAFARAHGIHYVYSPADVASSNAFLDETLRLARDPSAWPVLIHCHACMDRTPAWMGIYRFVVQGKPLDEILQEIERHRGYRPKASVILLYNRVLAPRAPEHYAADPTAALLRRCAAGTVDPYEAELRTELRQRLAHPDAPPRLSRRMTPFPARRSAPPGRVSDSPAVRP
jgi:protein tyrosine phosphatase (PTP) superfamily phosphohydrolase (DUF442 family)